MINEVLIENTFSVKLDTERKVLITSGSHHSGESEVYMIPGTIIFSSPVLLFEDGWKDKCYDGVFVIEYSERGGESAANLLTVTLVETSGKYGPNFVVIDSSTDEFYDSGLFEKFSELI